MNAYEQTKYEMELMNFRKMTDCQDIDQIRFCVRELCLKIEEFEKRFSYVPAWAYSLLAQYNDAHNKLVCAQFTKTYM